MATTRPTVSVFDANDPSKVKGSVAMPHVMLAPIRPDLVQFVHSNMNKNHRQAYAVADNAGYQTSAESWGTGRAVARIPRVPGGGTHRAGQGAFGNMCRGGGMFNPNKTWRKWHCKTNVTQKRHALASAISASSVPGIVMARGHRIDDVPELPLVVSDEVQLMSKTSQAMRVLDLLGCKDELEKVKDSKKVRCGKGKSRNRRYTMRKGPLVIYADDSGLTRSLRNIPGVDLCHIDRLNLLKLAPGGTLGRFTIWTEAAFKRLQPLYGNYTSGSQMKNGYTLPRPLMTNADLSRIINSDVIQSVVRPCISKPLRRTQNKNALTNHAVMCRLNPAHARQQLNRKLAELSGTRQHETLQRRKRARSVDAADYCKKSKNRFYKSIDEVFNPKLTLSAATEEDSS